MAESIGVAFQITGLEGVKAGMRDVSEGLRRTGEAARQASAQTQQAGAGMMRALAPVRGAVSALSSALSSTATILRMTGAEGQAMARHLETAALAISAVTVAVQTLRGATLALTAAMVALRAGMAGVVATAALLVGALTAPFTIALTGALALGVGIALLDQKLRGVKNAFAESTAGANAFADALMRGQVSIFGQGRAFEALRARVKDLAVTEAEWAKIRQFVLKDSPVLIEQQYRQSAATKTAKDMLSPFLQDLERWRRLQMATADTIEDTTARLVTQRSVLEEYISRLAEIPRHVRLSADEHRRLQQAAADVTTEIGVLNIQITNLVDSYSKQIRKEFELQRAMERRPEINDAVIAAINRQIEAETREKLIAEAQEATRKRMLQDLDAYRAALEEAARAQEDWNRQNEFDAQQQGRMESALQARITAHQRSLELMDEGIEKRRAEQASLQELIQVIQAEIDALNAEIAAKIAAGLPTEALIQSHERLAQILGQVRHEFELSGRALTNALLAPIRELVDSTERAFEALFVNVLSGAQSFGETLRGFFQSLVNSIIATLARLAASAIVKWIVGLFLGGTGIGVVPFLIPTAQRGGIFAGGLTPLMALQGGGIVNRPSLAVVGEGRQSEAVVPLPDNRSIPVSFTGRERQQRPQEIIVKSIVLLDRSQMPRTDPDEIIQVVVADIRSRGPIERVIRKAVGGR